MCYHSPDAGHSVLCASISSSVSGNSTVICLKWECMAHWEPSEWHRRGRTQQSKQWGSLTGSYHLSAFHCAVFSICFTGNSTRTRLGPGQSYFPLHIHDSSQTPVGNKGRNLLHLLDSCDCEPTWAQDPSLMPYTVPSIRYMAIQRANGSLSVGRMSILLGWGKKLNASFQVKDLDLPVSFLLITYTWYREQIKVTLPYGQL